MTLSEKVPLAEPAETDAANGFTPKFRFDIEHGNAGRFGALVEQYEGWHQAEPVNGPLGLPDGWHEINPAKAETLLRRNYPGANRKVAFATIQYYANQMKAGEWPKTGQPLIFNEKGMLIDGQHRLWAALLGSVSFTTFVVTVPDYPQLFAYLDNCKPRAPAAALQTAGYNGQSPTIAAILKIATEIDGYTPSSTPRMARMSPLNFLRAAEAHPNARKAARLAASDWEKAVWLIGHKDVVGYVGMRIMDLHGQETADDFFGELVDYDGTYPEEGAIMKLRKLARDDQKKEKPMKRHQVLGNVIKAFNAWHHGAELPKRWVIAVNDEYPRFNEPAADDAETSEPVAA